MSKKIILIIIVLIAFVSFGVWVKKFIAIDGCLDSGGRWDYERGKCVNYEKTPEVDKCLNDGGRWDYERNVCRKPSKSQ